MEAFDEAASKYTHRTRRYEFKSSFVLDGYPTCIRFLGSQTRLPTNQLEQAPEILRDSEFSLQPHNESLFQKVNFLMQAAMGYINIEQNKIMKFFSVVSVMFLPATLVASTYSMNFEFMPELHFKYVTIQWRIGLMIAAALTPYIYFYKKRMVTTELSQTALLLDQLLIFMHLY